MGLARHNILNLKAMWVMWYLDLVSLIIVNWTNVFYFLQYLQEMHYRRTCLLVDYEDANRTLDKAKPHKRAAVSHCTLIHLDVCTSYFDL